MTPGLRFIDDDGVEVAFDDGEVPGLLALVGELEAATVSACPDCRARVLAAVALGDVLDATAPHPRADELRELVEDAPTLHIFLVDGSSGCRHRHWRDPLAEEWREVVGAHGPQARR